MVELKFSTRRGKEVYKMSLSCQHTNLNDLYKHPSVAKINAYNKYLNEYRKTENSHSFGVGNANSFGFTAAWYGKENDDFFLRVETKNNSYKVWLTR